MSIPFKPWRAIRLAAALIALVSLTLSAACGGDDDASSTAVPTTTAPGATSTATAQPTAAAAFPFTFTDSSGTAVTFTEAPKRIISYSPGATETLFAVGAGAQVVAVDKFANYPPEVASLPKLEYSKPAPEPAVALNPDLIIMASRQEGQVAQFRALGLRVVLLNEPADLPGIYDHVVAVGRITGHAEKGVALAADMRRRVDAASARLAKVDKGPKIFFEVTADGYTAGPDSFIGSLLKLVKATNVAADAKTAFPQLSTEVIIAANPDVILLADGGANGGQSLETVRARPAWGNIAAVKAGRVHVIDSDVFTRPGPRVADAVEQLVKLLYPDLP